MLEVFFFIGLKKLPSPMTNLCNGSNHICLAISEIFRHKHTHILSLMDAHKTKLYNLSINIYLTFKKSDIKTKRFHFYFGNISPQSQ